ncbi:tyrosine-protein phosphatase [Propionibacteriaceae bacterium G57]|uniref:tyrosine-protein phosphatase n=1 Tax=Aestuariimicrobium sp. G57 TaxID=3418485 RepID=UPI003DA7A0E6
MTTTEPVQRVPDQMPTGLYNLRWVGGGQATPRLRPERLWRSSALLAPNPGIADDLAGLGVRTVLDLRDESERVLTPTAAPGDLAWRWVPIFDNQLGAFEWDSLDALYGIMLDRFAGQLAAAVAVVAEALPDPVLVHCTAGKDRTGNVIALVQDVLGVPRERILADYHLSAQLLGAEYLADLSAVAGHEHMAGEAAHRVTASPVELLAANLERFDERGGSRQFLLDSGLTPDHLDLLARHLLED